MPDTLNSEFRQLLLSNIEALRHEVGAQGQLIQEHIKMISEHEIRNTTFTLALVDLTKRVELNVARIEALEDAILKANTVIKFLSKVSAWGATIIAGVWAFFTWVYPHTPHQ